MLSHLLSQIISIQSPNERNMDFGEQHQRTEALEQVKILSSVCNYIHKRVTGDYLDISKRTNTRHSENSTVSSKLKAFSSILARHPEHNVISALHYQNKPPTTGGPNTQRMFVAAAPSQSNPLQVGETASKLTPELFAPSMPGLAGITTTPRSEFENHFRHLHILQSRTHNNQSSLAEHKLARERFTSYVLRSNVPNSKYTLDYGTQQAAFLEFFLREPPKFAGRKLTPAFEKLRPKKASQWKPKNGETPLLVGNELLDAVAYRSMIARKLQEAADLSGYTTWNTTVQLEAAIASIHLNLFTKNVWSVVHYIIQYALKPMVEAADTVQLFLKGKLQTLP